MFQAIFETGFDAVYLISVICIGIYMIVKGRKNPQYLLFGIMAVTLGAGDAFHLVPRAYALCTTGLDNYVVQLGIGKLITSITMTVFYILLYYVFLLRYKVKNYKYVTLIMYALAVIRIVLCCLPQNQWTSSEAPLYMGIVRNIPFALMGILVIVLFIRQVKKTGDKSFKYMGLTIILSFAFYIPVVLLADKYPLVGMLMVPKTLAYVWTILIGLFDMKSSLKKEESSLSSK